MKKGFTPVLMVLIGITVGIVLISVYGWWFTKYKTNGPFPPVNPSLTSDNSQSDKKAHSEDETANWKTYTNTDPGFEYEIKYPPNWKIYSDPKNVTLSPKDPAYASLVALGLTNATSNESPNHLNGEFLLSVNKPLPLEENLSLKQLAQSDDLNYHGETIRTKEIGQYDAVYWEFNEGPTVILKNKFYIISNKQKFTVIRIQYSADQRHIDNDLFDQILATFKFLE